MLAAQAPWWEPGTASGYHAITQGYLVGEVVRRVTGESVGTFFAKEVAGPLGADFHIGTPEECDPRVALVIPPSGPLPIPENPSEVLLQDVRQPADHAPQSWEIPWRRAEIPAGGGHGNARSVAMVQSALSNGGETGGTRLLSAKGCEAVFDEQINGVDLVLGMPVRMRHELRPELGRPADQPEPARLLLGRLGRLDRRQRLRRADDRRLRDEPHGRGHRGRPAGRLARDGRAAHRPVRG